MAPTEEDVADDAEVQIEEEEEEIQAPRVAHDPAQPTERQLSEHRVTHLPYRSWCKWCVLGRGRGIQHRRGQASTLPVIGIDYFFITSQGVRTTEELMQELAQAQPADSPTAELTELTTRARNRGDAVKCLLIRDHLSKSVFAHVVPHKGTDENNIVADMVISDLEWLGYSRIILKTDGEPAVRALAKRVIELAKVEVKDLTQITAEQSAAYDSQSNGGTEVGVQLVRGLFRTLRLCLEARLDATIPVDHAMTAWMIEHTCLLYNISVKGNDGLTPWARVRGRAFKQQMLGIGEAVLYKHPSKGPKHAPSGNMGARGGEGVFLGFNRASNTFIVGGMEARSYIPGRYRDSQNEKGGTPRRSARYRPSPISENNAKKDHEYPSQHAAHRTTSRTRKPSRMSYDGHASTNPTSTSTATTICAPNAATFRHMGEHSRDDLTASAAARTSTRP